MGDGAEPLKNVVRRGRSALQITTSRAQPDLAGDAHHRRS